MLDQQLIAVGIDPDTVPGPELERWTWSWRFSTQRSYPQAEPHLGCRGRQDDLLLDVPKQTLSGRISAGL